METMLDVFMVSISKIKKLIAFKIFRDWAKTNSCNCLEESLDLYIKSL